MKIIHFALFIILTFNLFSCGGKQENSATSNSSGDNLNPGNPDNSNPLDISGLEDGYEFDADQLLKVKNGDVISIISNLVENNKVYSFCEEVIIKKEATTSLVSLFETVFINQNKIESMENLEEETYLYVKGRCENTDSGFQNFYAQYCHISSDELKSSIELKIYFNATGYSLKQAETACKQFEENGVKSSWLNSNLNFVPKEIQGNRKRHFHQVISLNTNKSLIFGGFQEVNAPLNETFRVELFDHITKKWYELNQHHPSFLKHVLAGVTLYTTTKLSDGRILFIGGYYIEGGFTIKAANIVTIYDPSSDKWNNLAPMPDGTRAGHTATLLPDGKVLVVGGGRTVVNNVNSFSASNGALPVLLYDPELNIWSTVSTLSGTRLEHTANLVGNKLYVIGGRNSLGPLKTAEIYDIAANTWTQLPPMVSPHLKHSSNHLSTGEIVIIGGIRSNGIQNDTFAILEVLNLSTNTWSTIDNHILPFRFGHTSTLHNGKLYVFGGQGSAVENSSTYKSIFLLNLSNFQIEEKPNTLKVNRSIGHSANVVENKIFILGGTADTNIPFENI